MRTLIVVAAAVCVGLATAYLVRRPGAGAPAKPMTLAEIQQRRGSARDSQSELKPLVSRSSPAILAVSNPVEPHDNADATLQLDRSMVGLPFALSESVEENCELWRAYLSDCDDLDTFLDRMKGEPRDSKWAPQIEQFIVKSLATEEQGALRVRALECRSSRCALEVASEAQSGIQMNWNEENLDLIMFGPAAIGYERDARTGIQTYVTVHTWRRQSVWRAEIDAD